MIKRGIFVVFLVLVVFSLFSLASATNLEVTKIDKGSVVIAEFNNPAIYDFVINNNGPRDNFEIYSLFGIPLSPKGTFDLPNGETTMEVRAYPQEDIRKKFTGFFTFDYEIKGQDTGIFQDKLTFKIVNLKDAVEVAPKNLHPDENSAVVLIKNKENTNLESANIRFTSPFFNSTQKVSLGPYEEAPVKLLVDKNKTPGLLAGPYVVNAEVEYNGAKFRLEGVINYLAE